MKKLKICERINSVIEGLNDANKMRAWLPFSPLNVVSISYDDSF